MLLYTYLFINVNKIVENGIRATRCITWNAKMENSSKMMLVIVDFSTFETKLLSEALCDMKFKILANMT